MLRLVISAALLLHLSSALQCSRHVLPPRSCLRVAPLRAAVFEQRPLQIGEYREGLISKITDYGFFVRITEAAQLGLVHVSDLSPERLPREEIEGWIEENVGPVGSKVQVEVQSLKFKKVKRVSLHLLDVIQRQHMEDLVFAPGPRRQQHGWDDEEDDES